MSEIRDELNRNLARSKKKSPAGHGVGDPNNPKSSWEAARRLPLPIPVRGEPSVNSGYVDDTAAGDAFDLDELVARGAFPKGSDYALEQPRSPTFAARHRPPPKSVAKRK